MHRSLLKNILYCTTGLCGVAMLAPGVALANPQDGVVSSGAATIQSSGNTLNINQSTNKAVIDWRGFDIAPNEATHFYQPSTSSITLNRVNDVKPSLIQGQLTANGNIIIVNPNGVMFSGSAQVDVGGLTATSSDIANDAFMNNDHLVFDKAGKADAKITNAGTITAREAGLVGLVAPQVENSGVITARLGHVAMASGDSFTLDFAGDGILNVAVKGDIAKQIVTNSGTIAADGGNIAMTAAAARGAIDSLVENRGTLRANAVSQKNGVITLFAEGSNGSPTGDDPVALARRTGRSTVVNSGTISASGRARGGKGGTVKLLADQVAVTDGAHIDVTGDAGGGTILIGGDAHGIGEPNAMVTVIQSNTLLEANSLDSGDAGKVVVWSDLHTTFAGTIEAKALGSTGAGGFVETSGKQILIAVGNVDASSVHGQMGQWLLDPNNITIQATGSDTNVAGSPLFTTTNDTAIVTTGSIQTALNAGTSVTITTSSLGANSQAGNIVVASNITKSSGGDASLTLVAANDITLNTGVNITSSAGKLNLTLNSDSDGSHAGMINLVSGNTITTLGGNLVMGGGADPTLGYAWGDAGSKFGIQLYGSTINTGAGSVTMHGHGYNNSAASDIVGVYMNNGASITTTSGRIDITGIGGAGTTRNYGVSMDSTGANLITTTSGIVNITGTGGVYDNTTNSNYGVNVSTSSKITSTGTGAIGAVTIIGTGAAGGTSNSGVVAQAGAEISTVDAALNITGDNSGVTMGASTNYGVYVSASTVKTTGTGHLTIIGKGAVGTNGNVGVEINNAGTISTNSGQMDITGVGGNGTSGNIGVELGSTGANLVTTTSGIMNVTGTGAGSTTLNSGVSVSTSSKITSTGPGAAGLVTVIGTGSAAGSANNYGVNVSGTAAAIATVNAGLTVTGDNSANVNNGTGNYGIQVYSGGAIQSTGTGNVTVLGKGAQGTDHNVGVYMNYVGGPTYSTISVNSGTLQVTGYGGTGGTSASYNNNTGIYMSYYTFIGSTGTGAGLGAVTVKGYGANDYNNSSGVYLYDSHSSISTVDANLEVDGWAGTAASTAGSSGTYGVALSSSIIRSTGTGNLVLKGYGANAYSFTAAVNVAAGSIVSTTSGSLDLTADSSAATFSSQNNDGLSVLGTIQTTSGHMTILAKAGTGTFASYGMELGAGTITSTTGIMDITGYGGGNSSAGGGNGILLDSNSAVISSTGNTGTPGKLTITGYGATSGGAFAGYGVTVTNGTITTVNADMAIVGTGATTNTSSNYGISIAPGSATAVNITSTGTGNMTLTGTGGSAGTTTAYGIQLGSSSGSLNISNGSGSLTLTGIGGAGTSNYGILTSGNKTVTLGGASSSGAINFITDSWSLGSTTHNFQTTGDMSFHTNTAMGLSVGASVGGTFNITTAQLGYFNWGGVLTLGDATNTQALTVDTSKVFGGRVKFINANTYDITLQNTDLASSYTGTGNAVAFYSGNNLSINRSITDSATTGTTGMFFAANGSITSASGKGVSGSGVAINMTFDSDYDNNSDGYIYLGTGTFASNGGSIKLGGGSGAITAGSGYAWGNATRNIGVSVGGTLDATGTASGGDIIINGKGYTGGVNTASAYGSYLSGTSIQTNFGGAITMYGTGGGSGTGTNDHGVLINSGTVSAVNGAITFNGTADNGTTGSAVCIGSAVTSTGTGAINITGNSSLVGTGAFNPAVSINAAVTAKDGDITVIGTQTASTANNMGIDIQSGTVSISAGGVGNIIMTGTATSSASGILLYAGSVYTRSGNITLTSVSSYSRALQFSSTSGAIGGANTTGNITLIQDAMYLGATANTIQTTGDITIKTNTAGYGLSVGASVASTLNVSTTYLGYLNWGGTLTFGDATKTGAMTIDTSNAFTQKVAFINSGGAYDMTLQNTNLTTNYNGAGNAFSFTAGQDLILNRAITDTGTTGTTSMLFAANRAVIGGNGVSGSGVGINMTFDSDYDNDSVGGIYLGGSYLSNGGSITMGGGSNGISAGSGYAWGTTGTNNIGVYIAGTLNAAGGDIILNGHGMTTGTNTANAMGVNMQNGANITTANNGKITINGIGGGSGTGTGNFGFYDYANTNNVGVSSGSGNISITGVGGSGGSNYGVYFASSGGTGLGVTSTGGDISIISSNTISIASNNFVVGGGSGNIILQSDTIGLAATDTVSTTGDITFKSYTAGRGLSVGANVGSTLNVSTAYLGYLTYGGTLTFGDMVKTGAITVDTANAFTKKVAFINTGGAYDITLQNTDLASSYSGAGNAIAFYSGGTLSLGRSISNSGTGGLLFQADTLSLTAAKTFSTLGDITINSNTAGRGMSVGASVASTLNVSNTYLGQLSWGAANTLTLGDATKTGAMTIDTSNAFTKKVSFTNASGYDMTLQNTNLTTNYNGAGNAFAFNAGQDLIMNMSLTDTAATGTANMALNANRAITFAAAKGISGSGVAINMTMAADYDNNSDGYISLNTGSFLSAGGSIKLGGGSGAITAGSGYAWGDATQASGVLLTSTVLTAAGGDIIINGKGYTGGVNTSNAYGIYDNGSYLSILSTTGTGNITLTGTGGGSGSGNTNYGVYLDKIVAGTTGSGTLKVAGTAGVGTTTGLYSNLNDYRQGTGLILFTSPDTINLNNGDVFRSIAAGAFNVVFDADSDANGVGGISTGGLTITTNGGNITFGGGALDGSNLPTGTAASLSFGNTTLSAGGGNIAANIGSGGIAINHGSAVNNTFTTSGGGTITIATSGSMTEVGGGSGSDTFTTGTGNISVSAGSIADTATKFWVFNSTSGDVTIQADTLTLNSGSGSTTGGNITINSYTAGRGMSVGASVASTLNVSTAALGYFNWGATKTLTLGDATKTGAMTIDTSNAFTKKVAFINASGYDMTLQNTNLTTNYNGAGNAFAFNAGRDLTLARNITDTAANGTANMFFGANGSVIWTTNLGLSGSGVAINATFDSDYDNNSDGYISLGSGTLTTNGGNVIMGGGSGAITAGSGYAWGNSTLATGITLASGFAINATGTASGGNIIMNGKGWTGGSDTSNARGVNKVGAGVIQTNFGGTIDIYGTGGGTGLGTGDYGIYIGGGSFSAVNGTTTLNGAATGGTTGTGVYTAGNLTATGSGGITIIATTSTIGSGGYNPGAQIGADITATDGDINITGTNTANNNNNEMGVNIQGVTVSIAAAGTGNINITGTATNNSAYGVQLYNGSVYSRTGSTTITSTSTNGLLTVSSTTDTVGGANMSGTINLVVNNMTLSGTTSFQTTGDINVNPYTLGRGMSIGALVASTLNVSTAALGYFNWGATKTLTLGDATKTGAMTIDTSNAFTKKVAFINASGYDMTLQNTDLTTNYNGAGNSITFTAGQDLNINRSITDTATTGSTSMVFNANRHIVSAAGKGISGSGTKINMAFTGDYDNDSVGHVWLNTGTFNANGGDITMVGHTNGGGGAVGFTGTQLQTTGTGNIDITGVGYTNSGVNTNWDTGVTLTSASSISAGTGHINITGTGESGNGDYAYGIYSQGNITTTGGDIHLIGQAGTGASPGSNYGYQNWGVTISSGTISTTNTGNITIEGTGGNSVVRGDQDGLYISGATVQTTGGAIALTGTGGANASSDGISLASSANILSTTGAITLTGIKGAGASSYGIVTATGSNVIGNSNTSGTITLIADNWSLANLSVQNTGDMNIHSYTTGYGMSVGASVASTFNVSTTNLGLFNWGTTGTMTLGDTTKTGTMTIDTSNAFTKKVAFTNASGYDMTLQNTNLTTNYNGAGNSFTFNAGRDLIMNMSLTDTAATGTTSMALNAKRAITFAGGKGISGSGVAINLTMGADSDADSDGYIYLTSGTFNTNGGNIVLGGGADPTTGYAYGNASFARGIYLDGTQMDAGGGSITMHGHGYNTGTTGKVGIQIANSSVVQTATSGNISLYGVGGTDAAGTTNHGLSTSGGSNITVVDGTMTLNGTNTGGSGNGVFLSGGTVSATNNGAINLTANNNSTGDGNSNIAAYLGTTLFTKNGDLTIIGTNTASAGGGNNLGVQVYGSGVVKTTGTGNLYVTGSATGVGISLYNGGSFTTASSGNITLTAVTGGIATNTGTNVIGGANTSGAITLVADSLSLAALTNIQTTGDINIKTYTAGRGMSVGANVASTLNVSTTALGYLNWGTTNTLTLGDAVKTGTMTIDTSNAFTKKVAFINTGGAYDMTLQNTNLTTNYNGAGNAFDFKAGRDLTLARNITDTATTGSANMFFGANGSVIWTSNLGLSGSGTALNLTFDADRDDNHDGYISLGSGTLTTNGGNVTIGGGSAAISANSGYAWGNGTLAAGITLASNFALNATGTASGGNIIMNGQGYTGGVNTGTAIGVNKAGNGTIQTNFAGTIDMYGIAGGTGSGTHNNGVRVGGGTISVVNGALTIDGTSTLKYGIEADSYASAPTITSTGTGAINLSGHSSVAGNPAIWLGVSTVTGKDGDINITGTNTLAGDGINFNNATVSISAGGVGNVAVVGNSGAGGSGIRFYSTSTVYARSGSTSLTSNTGISFATGTPTIGGANTSGAINLVTDWFSFSVAPTVQTTGDINIHSYTAGYGMSVGASVASTLNVTTAALGYLNWGGTLTLGDAVKTGAMTIDTANAFTKKVAFTNASGYDITLQNTDLTTNYNSTGNAFAFYAGRDLNLNMSVTDTAATSSANMLFGANRAIISATGKGVSGSGTAINMTFAADYDNDHDGYIYLGNGTFASGGGNITLGGGSGAITAGSGYAWGNATRASGVTFATLDATGSASGGNIIVNGQGYTGGVNTANAYGVYRSGGTTQTNFSGNITVTGIGGGSGSGTQNNGVFMQGGTISVVNGTLAVTGTGGNTNNNYGVYADDSSANLTSTGTGAINVTGSSSGSAGSAILWSGTLTGLNGDVTLNGTNSGTGVGVQVSGGTVTIGVGGTGNIIVNGTAAGVSPGVDVDYGGVIASRGGNITVTSVSGGTRSLEFDGTTARIGNANTTGTITLVQDSIYFHATTNSIRTTGDVVIHAYTAGTGMSVGANVASTLNISDTGLGYINYGGTLTLGDTTKTGTMTIDSAYAFPHAVSFLTNTGYSTTVSHDIASSGAVSITSAGISGGSNAISGTAITLSSLGDITLGALTGTGAISATIDSDNNGANTGTFGAISGAGATFTGGTNDNFSFGSTVASAGNLSVTGNNITVTGALSTTANGTATFANTGTLALNSSTATSTDGAFNQSGAGAVTLAAGITTTNDAITLAGSTTLSAATTTLNSGSGVITLAAVNAGANNLTIATDANLVIGGDLTGTGTLTIKGVANGTTIGIGAGATGVLNINAAEQAHIVDGWNNIIIGSNTGTGTINLSANTWADNVTIYSDSGDVNINATQTMGANNFTVSSTSGNIVTDLGPAVTGTGAISLTGGSITGSGALSGTTITLSSLGNITLGALTGTGAISTTVDSDNNGTNTGTFGAISGAGATFAGGTNDSFVFNNTVASAGNLSVTGNNITVSGALTTTANGTATFANTGTLTLSSTASTDGAFAQTGAGAVSLGGNITTTNDNITFNSAPDLAANVTMAAGSGAITLPGATINNKNLSMTGSGARSITGTISGTGDVNISGGSSITGGGAINAGAITLSSLGDITLGALTGTGAIAATVDSDANGANTLSLGAISGAGVTLTGTSNDNITLSSTVASAGNLSVTGNNITVTGAVSTTSNGTATFANTGTLALNSSTATSTDGAFNQSGAGAVTLGAGVGTTNDAITFNGAVTLAGNSTFGSGSATTTFGSTVNGGYDVTGTAATFSLGGAWGGSTRLGAVSLTSTNALTLPAITAASLLARTSGAAADLTLGGNINTNGAGATNATLVAGRNFLNTSNNSITTGASRWLIYSTNTSGTDNGTLTQDFNRYSCSYLGGCAAGVSIPGTGNGMIYSYTPTLTVTADATSATYGDAIPSFTSHITGYLDALDSGAPGITGAASYTTPYTLGSNVGTYDITANVNTLASSLGYSIVGATRSNGLTIDRAALSVTADAQSKNAGAGDPALTYTYGALKGSDNASVFSGGLTRAAGETAGTYAIGLGTLSAGGNYTISFLGNNLTITGGGFVPPPPPPVTQAMIDIPPIVDYLMKSYRSNYEMFPAPFLSYSQSSIILPTDNKRVPIRGASKLHSFLDSSVSEDIQPKSNGLDMPYPYMNASSPTNDLQGVVFYCTNDDSCYI